MTLNTFATVPLTINDIDGSEASSLPVRGQRLQASHAVGLVREPCRTHATSLHMAHDSPSTTHMFVPPRCGQDRALSSPLMTPGGALRDEQHTRHSSPRHTLTYSFCVSDGRLAAARDDTKRTAAHTVASAVPTTGALQASQATPTPPDGQSVDRHSHIFPQKNKRQTKRSPATTQKCQQCDRLLQQSVAAPRRGGNYHTLVLKP